jgi:hypothetical protein
MSWLRAIYNFFYEIFFGCSHGHLTRVFTMHTHSYKVCLDCGHQLPYSLEKMRAVHSWEAAKLHPQITELTPVSISSGFSESVVSGFSEDEDYHRTKAIA